MPVQFLINLLQRNVQIKIDLPSKLKSPETWAFLEYKKTKKQVKPLDDFITVLFTSKMLTPLMIVLLIEFYT